MPARVRLILAMLGMVLYIYGYIQGSSLLQAGGVILVVSMFAIFMARKLKKQ